MVAAQIRTTGASVEVGDRKVLFPVEQYFGSVNYTSYDVSGDDQRFLMMRAFGAGDVGASAVIIVENWFEELKAKVGN